MNREEVRNLIERCYAARRRGDVEAVLETFHPEGIFRLNGGPDIDVLSAGIVGRAALRELFGSLFAAWDWKEFMITNLVIDGERASVHCAGPLVYVPTMTRVVSQTLDLVTIRDGKVVELIEFCDTQTLVKIISGQH